MEIEDDIEIYERLEVVSICYREGRQEGKAGTHRHVQVQQCMPVPRAPAPSPMQKVSRFLFPLFQPSPASHWPVSREEGGKQRHCRHVTGRHEDGHKGMFS